MWWITQMLAEPGKTTAGDLVIPLGITVLLSVALFGFGFSREKDGGPAWVKYLSFLPLIPCAIYGYKYFKFATDDFAIKGNFIGGNSALAYKAIFVVPIVLGILLIIVTVIAKRFIDNESRL